MLCANCGKQAHHIISRDDGYEYCENCSDLSITSKNRTDGILTRNSWRVRRQQSRHEGDMVRPHLYDKTKHREVINPDFVKLYGPEKTKQFFSEEQMKQDGYGKMPETIKKQEAKLAKDKAKYVKDTVYSGSSKKAITKFLQETSPA